MQQIDTNIDILACILAMKGRLVQRDVLLFELKDWARHRNGPFEFALRERGILTEAGQESLGILLEGELARHDGDPTRCLSSLEVDDAFRRALGQIDDRDLQDSVVLLGTIAIDDPAATRCVTPEQENGPDRSHLAGEWPTQVGGVIDPDGLERTQVAACVPEDRAGSPMPASTVLSPHHPMAADPDKGESTCVDGPADSLMTRAPGPLDSMLTRGPSSTPSESPEAICVTDPSQGRRSGDPSSCEDSRMRFRFLRHHARGGLGEVSVAHDVELRREVALKEIRSARADHEDSRMRFVQEAEITGQLEHPGVVPVYGLGRYEDGRPYYAMRFIRGRTLKEVIEAFHAADSARCPLELRQLLGRFVDVCNTIAYAHSRQIIHRDIKPDNIMLGEFGETLVVDWGLAKPLNQAEVRHDDADGATLSGSLRNSSSTIPGSVMGTPQYMSPEQAAGNQDQICPASDIYSLGSTLYYLLTGRGPYVEQYLAQTLERVRLSDFPRPRTINRAIPPALEAICLKAMKLRPEDRYETARALGEDVERWLADLPVEAMPEPWTERLARWSRRHRAWVQAGAASLLVVAIAAVASLLIVASSHRREAEQRQVAESLRRDREQRVMTLRAEAQDLILKGQQALDVGQAPEAKLMSSRALAAIGPEPELANLKVHAERLLEQSNRRIAAQMEVQIARDRLARFRKLHDEALFHGTLLTGLDQAASLDATRKAVREALGLYGLDADAPGGSIQVDSHLDEAERKEVETTCYELLLVHAEAVAQPLTRAEADDPGPRNRLALETLDRAERLCGPSRALQMRRADYRRRLGDEAGAAADRARGDALPTIRPVDAFLLGEQSYRPGEHEKAIRSFERALQLQPDHFWAQYFLAASHLKQNRPDLAKAGLTACLARRPDFPWIYLLRGYAHGELKEFDAAEADFRHVLESKPDELALYASYVNRGGMRVNGGKAGEAVEDLKNAIRLKPAQYQAHANLGLAYQALGRPREALEQFDRAIGMAPGTASLHRKRAWIYRNLGEFSAALRDFDQAARLDPAGSRIAAEDQRERGRILHQLGRLDEAVKAYSRARAGLPDDRELQKLLANALLADHRGKEALEVFNQYLGVDERDPAIYRLRGFERAKAEDHAGALADYTTALALDPNSPSTRARRGWGFLNQSARLAFRDFDEAIKVDPAEGDLYNGRGYAQALLGRHPQAVQDAEQALRLGAGSPDARYRLGLFYNAASIYSLAAGSAARGPELRDDPDLAKRHQDRAVELVRKALDILPADSRAPFLRQAIEDPAFLAIRDYPPFLQLASEVIPPKKP